MKRVLIVDDEENTRVALAKLLIQDGYNVAAVANGVDALKFIAEEIVDLVITDINMPEMNGLIFLRELNQSFPEMKVIMITAYGGVGSYLEAMDLGTLEYLKKPVKLNDLTSIMRRIFNHTSPLKGSAAVS